MPTSAKPSQAWLPVEDKKLARWVRSGSEGPPLKARMWRGICPAAGSRLIAEADPAGQGRHRGLGGEFPSNSEKLEPVRRSEIGDSQRGVRPSLFVVLCSRTGYGKVSGTSDSNLALKTPSRLSRTDSETGCPVFLVPPRASPRG